MTILQTTAKAWAVVVFLCNYVVGQSWRKDWQNNRTFNLNFTIQEASKCFIFIKCYQSKISTFIILLTWLLSKYFKCWRYFLKDCINCFIHLSHWMGQWRTFLQSLSQQYFPTNLQLWALQDFLLSPSILFQDQ